MSFGRINAGKADILLSIRNNTRRGLNRARRDLEGFARRTASIGAGITGAGLAAGALFVPAVREFARVEQLLGRFDAVFSRLGESAGQVADQIAADLNVSGNRIRGELAQFQSFFLGLGFDAQQSLGLSETLERAAQDLIAFDDEISGPQEAIERLLATLTGQQIAARRLRVGADIREASVDAELLSQGIAKTAREADETERVLARLAIVTQAFTRAGVTGQAQREVETLAARFIQAGGAASDFSVEVIGPISNILSDLAGSAIDSTRALGDWIAQNQGVAIVAAASTVAVIGLGGAITATGLAVFAAAQLVNLAAITFGVITAPITALIGLLTGAPLVLAGAGLAIAAFVADLGGIRTASESALSSVGALFSGLGERSGETFEAFTQAIEAGNLEAAFRVVTAQLQLEWANLTGSLSSNWNAFVREAASVFSVFADEVTTFFDEIALGAEQTADDIVTNLGSPLLKGVASALEGVANTIEAVDTFDIEGPEGTETNPQFASQTQALRDLAGRLTAAATATELGADQRLIDRVNAFTDRESDREDALAGTIAEINRQFQESQDAASDAADSARTAWEDAKRAAEDAADQARREREEREEQLRQEQAARQADADRNRQQQAAARQTLGSVNARGTFSGLSAAQQFGPIGSEIRNLINVEKEELAEIRELVRLFRSSPPLRHA